MDWRQSEMEQLYQLYKQYFHELQSVTVSANRTQGSCSSGEDRLVVQQSSKVRLECECLGLGR